MPRLPIAMLLWLIVLVGCPAGEKTPDASATFDAAVVNDVGADATTEATLPRDDNPFLGGFNDSWSCERKVCEPGSDPYGEMKAWTQSHEDCEPIPGDLLCRVRADFQGTDWPTAQDTLIDEASVASGGLTDAQVQALKCFGALDSLGQFGVYSWHTSQVPESIRPDALITLDTSMDRRMAFEQAFGPAIGVALAIGPEYSFRSDTTTYTITWLVESWKGVAINGRYYVEAQVDPEPSWGPNHETSCPGRYRLVSIQTNISRGIENVDVVPTITAEMAESIVTESGCWFDNSEYGSRETQLVVSNQGGVMGFGLFWLVRVVCQVEESCGTYNVPFDVWVEAHSGAITREAMDAVIDCF